MWTLGIILTTIFYTLYLFTFTKHYKYSKPFNYFLGVLGMGAVSTWLIYGVNNSLKTFAVCLMAALTLIQFATATWSESLEESDRKHKNRFGNDN